MKVAYLKDTPFGDVIYDPESRKGISISDVDPVVIEMTKSYDHTEWHPSPQEFEIDPDYFKELMEGVNKFRQASSQIVRLVRQLPPEVKERISFVDGIRKKTKSELEKTLNPK